MVGIFLSVDLPLHGLSVPHFTEDIFIIDFKLFKDKIGVYLRTDPEIVPSLALLRVRYS